MDRILELLRQRIGLDASSVGAGAVAAAVRRTMREAKIQDVDAYFERIQHSADEMRRLVEEVVVKETWFGRDSAPFAHLMQFVRTQWSGGVLRVLSAPCASGEEPYSLAMSLLEAGLAPRRFSVDAVDISESALERARQGRYGANSFRGETMEFRDKHFTRQGNEWVLHDEIKSLVNFRQGNLATGLMALVSGPYDIIFCRNFLIYLDKESKRRVERELAHLLHPEGVLCVGHAEAAAILGSCFTPVGWPRSFSFRFKPGAQALHGMPAQATGLTPAKPFDPALLDQVRSRMSLLKLRKDPEAPRRETRADAATASAPAPAPAGPSAARGLPITAPGLAAHWAQVLEQAHAMADRGQLDEALTRCRELVEALPMDARAHHLTGIVLHALGREDEAEEELSRTVYLEPLHYEALAQLALIRSRHGDELGAKRFRERAERALMHREPRAEARP